MLILGCGYLGEIIGHAALNAGLHVTAIVRDIHHAKTLQDGGIAAYYCPVSPIDIPVHVLRNCNILLDSIPLLTTSVTKCNAKLYAPQKQWLPALVAQMPNLQRVGYISSTSVYGDHQGAWVDETTICKPSSKRGQQRLLAESAWHTAFAATTIFRLAGLYGNERNIITRLLAGNYAAVSWSIPNYSNRIHAADAANAILQSLNINDGHDIINLADDEPCSHVDYVISCAKIIGAPAPLITMATPQQKHDNKRVSNKRLHHILPFLQYPNFNTGITHLWHQYLTISCAKSLG